MNDTIFYLAEWMQPTYYRGGFSQDDMCAFAEWYHQKREQERQGPAPDRDELAVSMPVDHVPQIKDVYDFAKVCEKLWIEFDLEEPESFVKATIEYSSRVRYMYADAMLKARKV